MFESGAVQTRVYFVDLETLQHSVLCLLFFIFAFLFIHFPWSPRNSDARGGKQQSKPLVAKKKASIRPRTDFPKFGQPTNLRTTNQPPTVHPAGQKNIHGRVSRNWSGWRERGAKMCAKRREAASGTLFGTSSMHTLWSFQKHLFARKIDIVRFSN